MPDYKKGDKVEGKFGSDWFPGKVTTVRTGQVHVLFDDGDKDSFPARSKKLRKKGKPLADVLVETEDTKLVKDPEQKPYDAAAIGTVATGANPAAPQPQNFAHHIIDLHRIEELDRIIVRLEALREVATTLGGRRLVILPHATDEHEFVVRVNFNDELVARTGERTNADGTTSAHTIPVPNRNKKDKAHFIDHVQEA